MNLNTWSTLDTKSINNSNYHHNCYAESLGIHSNWNYRKYIQQHANQIMQNNTYNYIHSSGNNPYTLNDNLETNYKNNNDLKHQYQKQLQMKSRMISPNIPTNLYP